MNSVGPSIPNTAAPAAKGQHNSTSPNNDSPTQNCPDAGRPTLSTCMTLTGWTGGRTSPRAVSG